MAQLASFGVADQYLVGDPEVTMFKTVYRRHTLFAAESIEQMFDGVADFGRRVSCTVSKNGDLVGPVWLEITVPDLMEYDVAPAPAGGNTVVTATAASSGLVKDPRGNYWQSLANDVYTHPVAFFHNGKYYAKRRSVGYETTSLDTNNDIYAIGNTLVGNASIGEEFVGELSTWPYLLRSGSGVPYTFAEYHKLRWCNNIGHALLSAVEIQIGGTRIDRHTGEWMDIWSELTTKEEKRAGLWDMLGKYPDAEYDASWQRAHSRSRTLYIPLQFCFNKDPGMYLPLVALAYHQITYNFEFRDYLECVKSSVPITSLTKKEGGDVLSFSARLFVDYIFLDAPERMRMAEIPHEYLITQVQFQGDEAVPAPSDPNGTRSRKYQLNYSHPVRELVWVYVARQNGTRDPVGGNNWFKYDVPQSEEDVFDEARLVINGHDRFATRPASYFRLLQPYAHHTRVPTKKIHVYSFSLMSPEDSQPSGQANWSRYDSAQLNFMLNPDLPIGKMKIFAYSFNVLRIESGLAGLAFAS